MNKKIIIYIAILGVIIAGGVGMFIFYSSSPAILTDNKTVGGTFPDTNDVVLGGEDTRQGTSSEIEGGQAPQITGQIALPNNLQAIAILDFPISAANISGGGTTITAVSKNGDVFKSDLDGTNQIKQALALLPAQAGGSFSSSTSLTTSKAIISPDGEKILNTESLTVLDLERNKEYPLSASDIVRSPAFSSDSKSIFFKYTNKANSINFLASSNFDLSGLKELFPLGFLERSLGAWGSDKILFIPKPSGLVFSDSHYFSIKEKKLKKAVSGYGLSLVFDKEGNRLAYSKTDLRGGNSTISVFNSADASSRETGIKTFAEKCVFMKISLLCAIPAHFDPLLVYPDSYYQKIFSPSDNIIVISPENSVVIKFINLSKNNSFDITSPFVLPDEKELFFINGKDSKLYRLPL